MLDKVLPVAAGIGGGSADAAAALRLLARANKLELDDPRLIEVARLTGADVPVCLASRACVMTGVGETLLPLTLPKMPCVLVNPCVPVATSDVFKALGLRHGELLVGATDVILHDPSGPKPARRSMHGLRVLAGIGNDLEKPAMRIQPVIGEVLSALRRDHRRAAGADVGLGRDLFCDFQRRRRCAARGGGDPARAPAVVGACGGVELGAYRAQLQSSSCPRLSRASTSVRRSQEARRGWPGTSARAILRTRRMTLRVTSGSHLNATLPDRTPPPAPARFSSPRPETAPAHRPPWRRNAGRG